MLALTIRPYFITKMQQLFLAKKPVLQQENQGKHSLILSKMPVEKVYAPSLHGTASQFRGGEKAVQSPRRAFGLHGVIHIERLLRSAAFRRCRCIISTDIFR
jgi:hypothetical protein